MQTLKYIRTNFPNTSNLFLSPAFFLSKYSIAPNTYKAFGICLLRSPVLLGVNERINTKLPRNLAGNRTLMESQLSIRWNECSEAHNQEASGDKLRRHSDHRRTRNGIHASFLLLLPLLPFFFY